MKYYLIFSMSLFLSINVSAQSAEDSVKMVISKLFEAMKAGDAVLLKSTFSDSAVLQTIARNTEGNIVVLNEELPQFIESIGKLPKGAADERITFDLVKVDGPLAIVWTPYKFYYNGNFSHCGVNSFQLVKIKNDWKIQYIIDTRRRIGCE